jgi:Fe-S-cluster-containing hydrogenase component 2
MSTAEHPDIQRHRRRLQLAPSPRSRLSAEELRAICLEAGADDVGFVRIDRSELDGQRDDILAAFPDTQTLVSIVLRMNREPIRTPARSIANLEFHHVGEDVDEVGRRIVSALGERGLRALNPAMAFPMEMHKWPEKMWVVAHKPVAVAAGLGVMGIHRNVIHPKFGNFILLGTVLMAAELEEQSQPLDYNPCLECKLCVAACPVGAVASDGYFDFSACYTHNYREFMGGFVDYVENVADASGRNELREKVTDAEAVSVWQSLSYGPNYKAAYCMAVCPAGEDVIGPFLESRKGFLKQVVKPLQRKEETLYVTPGSDAEKHAQKRYPHKPTKRVGNGLRPKNVAGFLRGLPLVFQRHVAGDFDATFHFAFRGDEAVHATVRIVDKTVRVLEGHVGEADVRVDADAATWIRYLRKEGGIVWPVLTRKIKVKGPLKLLQRFEGCFSV